MIKSILLMLMLSFSLSCFAEGDINFVAANPDQYKPRVTTTPCTLLSCNYYDIYLTKGINDPTDYEDVVRLLRNAGSYDTFTFHLIGFGGHEDGMFYLMNAIQETKAKTIMSVEGDVYSAHAYLAISGQYIIMSKYSSLMFHFSDVLNLECDDLPGTDRGVPDSEHCRAYKNNAIKLGTMLVKSTPFLIEEEKKAILTGHDVYLTSTEFYKRIEQLRNYCPKQRLFYNGWFTQ